MVDASDSSEPTIEEVSNSFLQRIATRPKILPYIDIVKWIIDNLDIEDRNFLTSRGKMIGSFKAKYLKIMYHIPDPKKVCDK